MNITCTFVNYYDDIAPEFAPDPIVVSCANDATVRVHGVDEWGHTFHVVCCGTHAAEFADDECAHETPLTEAFKHGYGQGGGEALLVDMSANLAAFICHEGVNEARPPRDVLSGTWAGESLSELGLEAQEDADEYEEGYRLGWSDVLEARATEMELGQRN